MSKKLQSGFSLLELLIVLGIALVLFAMAVPLVGNTGASYANLLQTARMRAVQDDRYYPIQTTANVLPAGVVLNACVDLNLSGACDLGVAGVSGAEPGVAFHGSIQIRGVATAPNTLALRALYLPPTCGANAACVTVNPNAWGPTFGPRGLPCQAPAGGGGSCVYTSTAGTAGVNGSPGNLPIAFETYIFNTRNQMWEAITVSPAGRIREWAYDRLNNTWTPLN
jgi:prepilin-type N-terminal cleavage/methylation domain-containing protein